MASFEIMLLWIRFDELCSTFDQPVELYSFGSLKIAVWNLCGVHAVWNYVEFNVEVGLKWLPAKLRNSNNIIIFLSFISQKSNGMGASKIKDQCATRAISSAFETRNIISYRESSCHERWMKKKFWVPIVFFFTPSN